MHAVPEAGARRERRLLAGALKLPHPDGAGADAVSALIARVRLERAREPHLSAHNRGLLEAEPVVTERSPQARVKELDPAGHERARVDVSLD